MSSNVFEISTLGELDVGGFCVTMSLRAVERTGGCKQLLENAEIVAIV